MGKAKKITAAAKYGSGGLAAVTLGLIGVLRAEAEVARRVIGNATQIPPDATGWYGRGRPGPAIRVALLGDSTAAGYGVQKVEETTGAFLGSGLAEQANRRVYVQEYAVIGAKSADLDDQVERALSMQPDVAVVLIGANDVTHMVRPNQSVGFLFDSVRRLRENGVEVVVGTCPDLGTINPIAPPLRQIARAWSRSLAAAQTIRVVEAGGRTVSLGSLLGPEFTAAPTVMFGPDQFHPSAEGYGAVISVMLPSVLACLGYPIDEDELEQPHLVRPVAAAALAAARAPGTAIGGTEVEGSKRGVRGLWVESHQQQRTPRPPAESPELEEQVGAPAATSDPGAGSPR